MSITTLEFPNTGVMMDSSHISPPTPEQDALSRIREAISKLDRHPQAGHDVDRLVARVERLVVEVKEFKSRVREMERVAAGEADDLATLINDLGADLAAWSRQVAHIQEASTHTEKNLLIGMLANSLGLRAAAVQGRAKQHKPTTINALWRALRPWSDPTIERRDLHKLQEEKAILRCENYELRAELQAAHAALERAGLREPVEVTESDIPF